jgi:hypothetical protein
MRYQEGPHSCEASAVLWGLVSLLIAVYVLWQAGVWLGAIYAVATVAAWAWALRQLRHGPTG